MDMHAVFVATGPLLKRGGAVVDTFDNIHVYSLVPYRPLSAFPALSRAV
jgi:hypothetical protein